jgi:hypothetical protein
MIIITPMKFMKQAVLSCLGVLGIMYLTGPSIFHFTTTLIGGTNGPAISVMAIAIVFFLAVSSALGKLLPKKRVVFSESGIRITRGKVSTLINWPDIHRVAASDTPPWVSLHVTQEVTHKLIPLSGLFDNLSDQKIFTRLTEYGRAGRWSDLFMRDHASISEKLLTDLKELSANSGPSNVVRSLRRWGWLCMVISILGFAAAAYTWVEAISIISTVSLYLGIGLFLASIWKGDRRVR